MHFVLAVTTYNRLHFLREFWDGFCRTRGTTDWTVIVADDGSTDGTLAFLDSIPADVMILNDRRGVADQTNSIFTVLEGMNFDLCFKCDDDILFLAPGWDALYYEATRTGYHHLSYDNPAFNVGSWCHGQVLAGPVRRGPLLARVRMPAIKGAFWTVTPEVLRSVGFMDSENFFHGHEHTDFSMRCARAGFADPDLAFDAAGSDRFLGYRFPWSPSQPALSAGQFRANGNRDDEIEAKKRIIAENRQHIPYLPCSRRMV